MKINNLLLLQLIILFFVSCGKDVSDNVDDGFIPLIDVSFQVDGNSNSGAIDYENHTIIFENIFYGDFIEKVTFGLADGVSVYPDPESLEGIWNEEKSIVLTDSKQRTYTYVIRLQVKNESSVSELPLPDPGTLKGVHWKTYTVPHFDNSGKLTSAEIYAKPRGITDYQKVEYLANMGLNLIALKLEDGGQMTVEFPGGENDDKTIWNKLTQKEKDILNEARAVGCARFVKAVHDWNNANMDKPVYVMLFTRKWFQNNGSDISGNLQDGANIFADVINICKDGGYDDALIGVHAVENRIDAMNSLLPLCLDFSKQVNQATNGWLKNKIMFFAGLSMGISFKGYAEKGSTDVVGIDECEGSSTFWSDIQEQCSGFSWVQKTYPKWDVEPTFSKYMDTYNNTSDSYEDVLENYLDTYGHRNLKNFVSKAPDKMFDNVMFWGDASDGMRHLSQSTRDVLKTIWINYGYYSGCFYHFFDIDAANNAETWNQQNNIAYLDNGDIKENVAFPIWKIFFDGQRSSTYGSIDELYKFN